MMCLTYVLIYKASRSLS